MKKYAAVRRLIRLCGRNVKLVMEATGEIKNVRAVIQPLRYRNNANAGGIYLPPGFSDLENYLYLGPATNRWIHIERRAMWRPTEKAI